MKITPDVVELIENFVKSSRKVIESFPEQTLPINKGTIKELGNAVEKYRKDLQVIKKHKLRAGDYVSLFYADAVFNKVLIVSAGIGTKKELWGIQQTGELLPFDINDAIYIGSYRKNYFAVVKSV